MQKLSSFGRGKKFRPKKSLTSLLHAALQFNVINALVVSLAAVQEMISIMQDYGEVVCCVGSSFNSANPAIFIQADIR